MRARACNCIGPQNGNPVCPCRMPDYRERELGRKALDILRKRAWPAAPEPPADEAPPSLVERIARVLYECEKARSDHADAVMSAAAGKTVSVGMEPWEECWQTFHSDAEAVLAALDGAIHAPTTTDRIARRLGAEVMPGTMNDGSA